MFLATYRHNGESVDPRTDLFAYGAVLYEMVTGRRAFAGESVVQTLSKIAHEEPTPLSEARTESPAELQRIVGKCLAKAPARRYQHADDVVVDLRALQVEVEAGTVPLTVAAMEERARAGASDDRRRAVSLTRVAAIVLVAVALGALAGRWLAPSGSPDPISVSKARHTR